MYRLSRLAAVLLPLALLPLIINQDGYAFQKTKAAKTASKATAPKATPRPEKHVPQKGTFDVEISSDGKANQFDSPSKALTELGKAVTKSKRKDPPSFKAVFNLNGMKREFSDAKDAHAACRAVLNANLRLRKIRMGLGDLGQLTIPEGEELREATSPKPNSPQAQAEVRRRIQAAMNQQFRGRVPNPQAINQIVQREVQKARQEGLLSDVNVGGGFGGDPTNNELESIKTMLITAFAKSKPASAAEGTKKAEPAKKAG